MAIERGEHISLNSLCLKFGSTRSDSAALATCSRSLFADQSASIKYNGENCKPSPFSKEFDHSCSLTHLLSIYTKQIIK